MFPRAFHIVRFVVTLLRRVPGLVFKTLWAEPARVRGRLWTAGFYCRLLGGGWLAVSTVCSSVSPAIALLGISWWIEKFLALKDARSDREMESTSSSLGAELGPDD